MSTQFVRPRYKRFRECDCLLSPVRCIEFVSVAHIPGIFEANRIARRGDTFIYCFTCRNPHLIFSPVSLLVSFTRCRPECRMPPGAGTLLDFPCRHSAYADSDALCYLRRNSRTLVLTRRRSLLEPGKKAQRLARKRYFLYRWYAASIFSLSLSTADTSCCGSTLSR